MEKLDIQAAKKRCECGDKIGFHDVERRLAAALEALEEAEAQVAVMAAGYDHAERELGIEEHVLGPKAALQLYRERIYDVRQKVRLSKAAKDLLGYKALAERLRKALGKYGNHDLFCRYGLLPAGVRGRRSFSAKENERLEREVTKECACGLLAAIDATPEQAREKEEKE